MTHQEVQDICKKIKKGKLEVIRNDAVIYLKQNGETFINAWLIKYTNQNKSDLKLLTPCLSKKCKEDLAKLLIHAIFWAQSQIQNKRISYQLEIENKLRENYCTCPNNSDFNLLAFHLSINKQIKYEDSLIFH